MLALLKRYRELLLVAALLVVPLVVYFSHAKRPSEHSWFDRAVLTATGPIEKVIGWGVTGTSRGWNGYVALRHAHERAEQLEKQVNALQMERQELLARSDEATRCQQNLLPVTQGGPERRYLGARVIGIQLDPKGLQLLTIDRGAADGIAKMMPVLVAKGVVGRIHAVLPGSSQVLLLTDRNSSVAVRVERTRARANVRGLDRPGICALEYMLRSEEVNEGDQLVTSGTDGVFPRGLPIGKITNVKRAGSGLYHAGDVIPAVDVTKLEEVLVITSTGATAGQLYPQAEAPPP